jgi:hypothetical protein
MRWSRSLRTVTTRVAIFAVLVGWLMPTLSHAVRPGASESWLEVCSTLGSKWVAAGDASAGDSAPAPTQLQPGEHCPYCKLHSSGLGLPPAPIELAAAPQLRFEGLRSHPSPARTRIAWVIALPRAPPSIS